ncbi:MAG: hypothetical protein WCK43_05615 [bacterium]
MASRSFEKGFVPKKSFKKKCQGQMLVAVMMMVTTVIVMFGMTVSVGHLVQSKINLQNSIDLSAMTAASYEARHMNALSVANYRIRSLFKFFLLDAYVTQSRFGKNFQSQIIASNSSGPIPNPLTTLQVCEIKEGFHPTLPGEIGDTESGDPCQYAGTGFKITPVIPSFFPGIDPAYIAINIALMRIADQFREACGHWKGSNKAWVKWSLDRVANNTNEAGNEFNNLLKDFKADLGNQGPRLIGPGGLAAGNTFRSNLLGSTYEAIGEEGLLFLNHFSERSFDTDDFDLSKQQVGMPWVDATWDNGCSIIVNPGGAAELSRPVDTGFSKKENGKIIQVALLSSAVKSSILFWPQGLEPTLVAVAAAKPFGSRMGPPKRYLAAEGSAGNGYGNVTLFPGDNSSALNTGGVGHQELLRFAFRRGLPAPGSAVNELRPKIELQQLAYTPSIFDGLYYSIFDYGNEDSDFYAPDSRLADKVVSAGMKDRGTTTMPDPYVWLKTLPSENGTDKFYKKDAITSAWSPDPEGDKRSGYQIKLLSIESACENNRNNPQKEARLTNLCATGQATL